VSGIAACGRCKGKGTLKPKEKGSVDEICDACSGTGVLDDEDFVTFSRSKKQTSFDDFD
jgi:DnaJ-class molecular chaperone